MILPKLYVIADAGVLARRGMTLRDFALGLSAAGVTLVQYRDKDGMPQEVLGSAAVLREVFAGAGATLIMNDRADFAVLAAFDGVHVGQGDLSPEDAKTVGGRVEGRVAGRGEPTHRMEQRRDEWGTRFDAWGTRFVVGVSTHTEEQVRLAELRCADYVAIGPVFATSTKADAEPAVGLEGVRRARALTTKPLVAIGGITRENALRVIEAGADSVAVISALFAAGETVEQVARDFLQLLG